MPGKTKQTATVTRTSSVPTGLPHREERPSVESRLISERPIEDVRHPPDAARGLLKPPSFHAGKSFQEEETKSAGAFACLLPPPLCRPQKMKANLWLLLRVPRPLVNMIRSHLAVASRRLQSPARHRCPRCLPLRPLRRKLLMKGRPRKWLLAKLRSPLAPQLVPPRRLPRPLPKKKQPTKERPKLRARARRLQRKAKNHCPPGRGRQCLGPTGCSMF